MNRRMITFLAMVSITAALVLTPVFPAAQSESESPLSEQEIYDFLQGGKTAAEVAEMVKKRGIGFDISATFEANLATLQADPVLLKTLQMSARLELQVGAAGAAVAVDGEDKGQTDANGLFVAEGLDAGSHVFRISSPDYVGKTVDYFFKPAETKKESVTLTSAISAAPTPYGTSVSVAAGTAADAALSKVYAASDPAEKAALLEQVLADFGDTPAVILANDLLQKIYIAQKNFDGAIAAGDKLIEKDPRNIVARIYQARAALGKGDVDGALTRSENLAGLIEKGKTLPAPEGVSDANWKSEGERTLRQINAELPSLQYDLFLASYQLQPATARSAALEKFLNSFPESVYRKGTLSGLALAYQEQGNQQKMMEWAEKALEANPEDTNMLMLASDYFSDQGKELARAEELAGRLRDLVTNQEDRVRTKGISDEQWASQKAFYEGISHTALGMIRFHQEKYNEAIQEFDVAGPFLKSQPFYSARNLFRKGVSYARMGGRQNLTRARTLLNQVIALKSPFTGPAQGMLQQVNQILGRR